MSLESHHLVFLEKATGLFEKGVGALAISQTADPNHATLLQLIRGKVQLGDEQLYAIVTQTSRPTGSQMFSVSVCETLHGMYEEILTVLDSFPMEDEDNTRYPAAQAVVRAMLKRISDGEFEKLYETNQKMLEAVLANPFQYLGPAAGGGVMAVMQNDASYSKNYEPNHDPGRSQTPIAKILKWFSSIKNHILNES